MRFEIVPTYLQCYETDSDATCGGSIVDRRVVITGMEVMAPGGNGRKAFWDMLVAGRTATKRLSFFDPAPFRSQVAAACDFDPETAGLSKREVRRLDRAAQLAVLCTRGALAESGLDPMEIDSSRTGVSVGSAVGATTSLEREYLVLSNSGLEWVVDPDYISPHLFDYLVPSSMAAEVAIVAGATGPATIVSTGCTAGLDSVGYAFQLIVEGTTDIMITGGSDAPISPIAVACFDAIKATTPRNDDPEHAARPFDNTRDGFVLAEGAAMFVLEELEHARARGASIYAEVAGYGAQCNAYHMTGLKKDGTEMAHAITAALDEARLDPTSVDYVNAHGSGTRQNDRHETAAFKSALGSHAYDVPVSSIKSMVGHSLGAIGSIEVAACALAIKNDVVPPTANLHVPDPECDLDYVPNQAREVPVNTALSVGSGFGGFQSAIVVRGIEGSG